VVGEVGGEVGGVGEVGGQPITLPDEFYECDRCVELCRVSSRVVGGEFVGDWTSTAPILMFVARNPGRQEDEVGRPLVGSAGKWFRREILAPLMQLEPAPRVYLTNMVKHFSPDNRPPTQGELDNCREWVDLEMERVQPNGVVLMGKEAQEYMFGEGPEERHKLRCDGNGVVWVSTYHPSYAAHWGRGTGAGEKMLGDSMKVWMICTRP
jgi:uracil-DNA glycosylase family 4